MRKIHLITKLLSGFAPLLLACVLSGAAQSVAEDASVVEFALPSIPAIRIMPAPKQLLYVHTVTNACKIRLRIMGILGRDLLAICRIANYNTLVVVRFGVENGSAAPEPTIWCQGAVHEISCAAEFAGYRFEPDPGSSMTFKVDVDKGYVF